MSRKFKYLKMNDVSVKIDHEVQNIMQHPYYLALRYRDENVYRKMIKSQKHQRNKRSATWQGYNDLVYLLDRDGFRFNAKDPIIIKKRNTKWIVAHGRHRMCIFRFLYGKYAILTIQKINGDDDQYMIVDIQPKP